MKSERNTQENPQNSWKNMNKIVYITRDIERALGIIPNTNYQIITNRTPYSLAIQKSYPAFVHLVNPKSKDIVNDQGLLDTIELLKSDTTNKIINDSVDGKKGAIQNRAAILVFKNTNMIETIAKENGWILLNPSTKLAEKIENKISQVEWLGEFGQKYLPPHTIALTKNLVWEKKPLIIQWEHGHTGLGTILINSQMELDELKKKFPERTARATNFINGPSFTVNIVVSPSQQDQTEQKKINAQVLIGNISYQITGLPPFTDNVFSTIGNDWSLTHSLLSESEIEEIHNMAKEIGSLMARDGWSGLFGLDIMRDDEYGKIHLIEINARQPASTTYESLLQDKNRKNGVVGITIFEAHLRAVFQYTETAKNSKVQEKALDLIIPINDGAQIIQRVTKKIQSVSSEETTEDTTNGSLDGITGTLELSGYNVIEYPNTELNTDFLRIQSEKGIMETHGKFNTRGKKILEILAGDSL